MSRASPFPTSSSRRPRSPPNGLTSPPATAPLSINRPPSRPVTPSNKAPPPPVTASPARPIRSGLRSRVPSNASTSYSRDGANTAAVDGTFSRRDRLPSGSNSGASTARPFTNGNNDNESPVSPAGMNALEAFKAAGSRRARRGDTDRDEERRREWEKEEAKQRKIKERSAARRVNAKPKVGDIDSILEDIKDEWGMIMDEDFNPVDLALSLLDEKSSGREMESFQRTRRTLHKALKGTIDKNYKAFAGALPHHSSLLNSLGTSESQISSVKQTLQQVREGVSNKRADLVQLWARGQQVEEMMKILDQIEKLKSIPDKLESLMSEKRLLPAAALLMNSLKIIRNQDMMEIGALADLRSYLVSQETSLREILIEELHAHLYVKTFWCDSRWVPYTTGQQDFPIAPFEEEGATNTTEKQDPAKPRQHTKLFRYLHQLTLRPNEPPADINLTEYDDDPSQAGGLITLADAAPESDSFGYIEHILESLAVLGKLGMALDIVSQRIPMEISNLIEATITEVKERVESTSRFSLVPTGDPGRITSSLVLSNNKAGGLRLAALELSVKESNREVLRDLFWTLYSKLDAVVQGLRVISEVSNRIGSRRTFKDSINAKPGSLFPLTEQWLPVQAEIRSLLHDYLVDEQSGATASRNPISSINEVLRLSMSRTGPAVTIRNQEQQMKVFRLADSDLKQNMKAIKSNEDQLSKALRETVPGLAKEGADGTVQAAFSSLGTEDRLASTGQHPLLLAPDAFHVGVLFQPTLAFLDRLVEILPAGIESARASSVFLDEFVLSVYLPQLEEKVTHLFHVAVSGPDAFREDVAFRTLHPQPLVKAAVQIMALVNTLCAMLQTTPFHKDNYSRLVLGIVIQFYQQCSDHFRDLVSRETDSPNAMPVILGAHWAQHQEISACLADLSSAADKDHTEFNNREIDLELKALGDYRIGEQDILPSTRDLAALCNLYTSVTWFTQQLRTLRPPSDEPETPIGLPETSASAVTPWTANLPMVMVLKADDPLQLPLTKEMTIRFVALLKTFQQLADVILFTIRLDVRCRVIRLLDQMARRSSYRLEREAAEPDPYIMELNNDLAKCDDATSSSLAESQRRFVFNGLGTLASRLLISSSSHIRFVNENGAQKMLRNILALQQNLKTIQNSPKEADLDAAKKYWGMFSQTPSQMLSSIRQKRIFNFNEYEAMLNYMCGVDPQAKTKDARDKNYNSYLIDLHELAGQDAD